MADLDGDGRGEVLVLSTAEKSLGVSRFEPEERLPFPGLLEVTGVPKAFDAGDVDRDGKTDVVVVVEGPDDKKYRAQVWLQKEPKAEGGPAAALVLAQVIQLARPMLRAMSAMLVIGPPRMTQSTLSATRSTSRSLTPKSRRISG